MKFVVLPIESVSVTGSATTLLNGDTIQKKISKMHEDGQAKFKKLVYYNSLPIFLCDS